MSQSSFVDKDHAVMSEYYEFMDAEHSLDETEKAMRDFPDEFDWWFEIMKKEDAE